MSNLAASSYESSTASGYVTFPGLNVEFDHTFQISLIHEPGDIYINMCTPGGWGSEVVCTSTIRFGPNIWVQKKIKVAIL